MNDINPLDPRSIAYFLDAERGFRKASEDQAKTFIIVQTLARKIRSINYDIDIRTAAFNRDADGTNVQTRQANALESLAMDELYRKLLEERNNAEADKTMAEAELKAAENALSLHRRRMEYGIALRTSNG